MPDLVLTGTQQVALQQALLERFNADRFIEFLLLLEQPYHRLEIRNASFERNVLEVIQQAQRRNWLRKLLHAAAESDPAIREIYESATANGTARPAPDDRSDHLVLALTFTPAGADTAGELAGHLRRSAAPVQPWTERGGRLRGADLLLLVATADATAPGSPCRAEVEEALAMGLDVIAVVHDAAAPRTGWTAALTAVDGRDGWADLAGRLRYAGSPRRRLRALRVRRDAVRRQLDGAEGHRRDRWATELDELDSRIALLELRLAEPDQRRVAGVPADDRAPAPAVTSESDPWCVGEPPAVPDAEFHDREPYLRELARLLNDPGTRMVALLGRGGIGKTGMIAKLLANLRAGAAGVTVKGFAYLPVHGFRPVNAATLVRAVVRMVRGGPAGQRLVGRLRQAVPWRDLLDEALDALSDCPVLVVIDNADELLDDAGRFGDEELREVVGRLLERRDHAVRLVLVGQPIGPSGTVIPEGSVPLWLHQGLPEDDARKFLLALDADHLLELRSAPAHDLIHLCRLVEGSPRALELAFALLSSAAERSVGWLIELLERNRGEVVPYALGWAFDRLELEDKRILQGLASYGRPVRPAAVDHLLRCYLGATASSWRLLKLHRLRLIRRETDGTYYVPPREDCHTLLATLDEGGVADLAAEPPPLTRIALYHRAADYFRLRRLDHEQITTIEHLDAHLAEIDLRIKARQDGRALDLIDHVITTYLNPWGYSSVVVPYLLRLAHRLTGGRELLRLSLLTWSYEQQQAHARVITHGTAALALARRLRRRRTAALLVVTIGNAWFQQDHFGAAAGHYRRAVRRAWWGLLPRSRPIRAAAYVGLGLCRAKAGDFTGALSRFAAVRRLLPRTFDAGDRDAAQLRVAVTANLGAVRTGLGDHDGARRDLDEAKRLAAAAGLRIDLGECHNLAAQLLIDQGRADEAIREAAEAAAIGIDTGDRRLCRDAQEMLALADLCRGELKEAADAIRVAVRHDPTPYGLGLQGIIAFRCDDRAGADAVFTAGLSGVDRLREADEPDYRLRDTEGILHVGLALCRQDPDLLAAAGRAFGAARAMTSARGVTDRVVLLLREFRVGDDEPAFAAVLAAARGTPN